MNRPSKLSDVIKTLILILVIDTFFQRWTECFLHCGILLVSQNHVDDLLLTLYTQSSEQDNHWNNISNLGNGSIYLSSSFGLGNDQLEL